jgi:putative membrane protein
VSTLILCIDRGGLAPDGPVVGVDVVRGLVTEAGIEDPEDSRVNCLLETLRVARELEAEGDEPIVAVVSGTGDAIGADRVVARNTDDLVRRYSPDSAVVVVDSAEDESLVPIVESRVRVDGVDRVVVRQAHDIESTYYLLKQFLADEELRATVLAPVGAALLAFPVLLLLADSLTLALSAIAAVIGVFLLYKGLGIDDWLAALPGFVRDAFYSGQVSLVTYVVGAGLALVGVFAGAIGVRAMPAETAELIVGMRFVFDAVPWLALAALTASTGRLFDEFLSDEGVRTSFLNLPFGVLAVGLVVRGFAGYFLEQAGAVDPLRFPAVSLGPVSVDAVPFSVWTRLAIFVFAGICISLFGVRFASYINGSTVEKELTEP